MALFSTKITLDGAVDNVATLAAFGGSVNKGVRQLTLQGVAGNAAATVGSKADVTAGGGIVIAAASTAVINLLGPFSSPAPTTLNELYIKGTNTNTFALLVVTQ